MAANSIPPSIPPSSMPPPSGGGNTKLAIIAIVLLLGIAGLVFVLMKKDPAPELPQTQITPPPVAQPVQPSVADDIEIPDELPDASVVADMGARGCPEGTVRRGDHCVRYVEVGGGGGNWDCSGNIDPARIRAAIAEHSGEVRTCYERRLKVNNTLQGNVSITVKIGAGGNVAATQVGGSLRDNEVFSCIRSMAERWHFPAPEGGSCAVARIPYNLTPNR